jgi:hypothetical protein
MSQIVPCASPRNNPDRCPCCHATVAEILVRGHRWMGAYPCAEACSCLPEHTTLEEHRRFCEALERCEVIELGGAA